MSATLVLSVEVELGWGTHDVDDFTHLSEEGSSERKYLKKFLEIADHYSVPITFNIVGELFDQHQSDIDTSVYPEGWFDFETDEDGLFFGPELVDLIDATAVDHEVCTHTYSHILFEEMSREIAEIELTQVQRIHADRYGAETVSLVPPRHQDPDKSLLRNHGFETVRIARPRQSSSKIGRFWELLVGLPFAHSPRVMHGIVETYVSRYPSLTVPTLPQGESQPPQVFKPIPEKIREQLYQYGIERALDEASKTDQVVHLWCHVYNLSTPQQISHLDCLFEIVSSRDDVQVLTMKELNDVIRSPELGPIT